jgi:hypothetical protein
MQGTSCLVQEQQTGYVARDILRRLPGGVLMLMEKNAYIKSHMESREQTRWDLSNPDDAATLYMELMELEFGYHHLAMLKYRLHKHKEFHHYFGMYWAIGVVMHVMFPYKNSSDVFSRTLNQLNRDCKEADEEYCKRFG